MKIEELLIYSTDEFLDAKPDFPGIAMTDDAIKFL